MLTWLLNKLTIFALHMDFGSVFPEPLSAKEEALYIEKMEAGDQDARRILIERNLRLVAHIIKKYYAANEDPDELISIGTIGLIKAVNTFRSGKGVRLGTYAARCIDNEILMYFRSRKKTAMNVSLEEPIEHDADGNPLTLMDVVAIEDTTLDQISRKNDIKKLRQFVNELKDEREKQIIILRYGLNGEPPMKQSEIAKLYGISRSYVSRIETKCLKRLRKRFESPDMDILP